MKKLFPISFLIFVIPYCNAQSASDTLYKKNQFFILPLAPVSNNLALGYERSLSVESSIGITARYFYSSPQSQNDTGKSSGFDGMLFYKVRGAIKPPAGFYARFTFTAGHYHSTAVYREKSTSIWSIPPGYPVSVSFISAGPGLDLGYEWRLESFSINILAGVKYMFLPGKIAAEHFESPLADLWGDKNWHAPSSPGSVLNLSLTIGYLF